MSETASPPKRYLFLSGQVVHDDDKALTAQTIRQQLHKLSYKHAVRSGNATAPNDAKFKKLLQRLDESQKKRD
jgi:hypothetical protein